MCRFYTESEIVILKINSLQQSSYCGMCVIASPSIFSQEFILEEKQEGKTHYISCEIHRQTLCLMIAEVFVFVHICADVPNCLRVPSDTLGYVHI